MRLIIDSLGTTEKNANYCLKGTQGDTINALLAAAAMNFQKLLVVFFASSPNGFGAYFHFFQTRRFLALATSNVFFRTDY